MADSIDDEDDFGDLYADLDNLNAGIATFNGARQCGAALEEDRGDSGVKNGESLGEDGQSSGEDRVMCSNQALNLVLEAESEENSESDDDLRIVLNEGGRSKMMGDAWRAYTGNRVQEGGDEKDNLVNIAGSNGLSDDCRRGGLVAAQGMAQEDRERKTNCSSWHAGSSSFAIGDWDHFMMQCLRDSSYCKSGLPVAGQSASCFSLPRNRTIFDIGIEAFERKPWKQPGVDITDYFNFGLDEDSWKGYWQSMEHLRYEAAMLMQNPCSLRHQVATGEISKESAEFVHGEQLPTMLKVERVLNGLEMIKGRAIQVESGIGERLPSIDIRRPRQRDEDVVIQIPMEKSSDDANIVLVELDHLPHNSTASSPAKYETKLSEGSLPADRTDRGSPSIVSQSKESENCDDLEDFQCELDYIKSGEVIPRSSSLGQDAASPSVNQADTILSYSYSASDREASKESDHSMKIHNLIRSTSSSSAKEPVKSDHLSDDFKSSDSEPEESDGKFDNKSISVDYRNSSRKKIKSEAMLRISSADEECYAEFHHQIDVHSKRISCQMKEGKYNKRVDFPKDLTSREDTERHIYYNSREDEGEHTKGKYSRSFYSRGKSSSYHRRRLVENHSLVDSKVAEEYNEVNHDNFHSYGRALAFSKSRSRAWQDYSLAEEDNKINHDKFHRYGSCLDYPKLRNGSRDDYHERIPSSEILYQEKASCSYRREQRSTCKEVKHDIFAAEKRSKAYKFELMKRRDIPQVSEVNGGEFVRQVAVQAVSHSEKRKRRKMHHESLCTEKDMSNVIAKPGTTVPKHLDWPLASDISVPQTGAKRSHGWLYYPVNIPTISWKSEEHYEDHKRHHDFIETKMQNKYQCRSHKSNDWNHYSSNKNRIDFECRRYITQERNSYYGDKCEQIRNGCASSPRSHTDEGQCLRRDVRVGLSSIFRSFPHERNSRHEDSHVDYGFESESRFPDADISSYYREKNSGRIANYCSSEDKRYVPHNFIDYGFESERRFSDADILSFHREKISGRNANYCSREDKRYIPHNFDKSSHNLRLLGREEASIMHLNGAKRKYAKRSNQGAAESRSNDGHIGYHNHIEETVGEFKLEVPDDYTSNKLQDKHQGAEDNEIEEGQLIEEPRKSEACNQEVTSLAIKASQMDSVQKIKIQSKNSPPNNQSFGGQDNTRLLETLAKMEKRRERFKEPLAPRQGTDNILNMPIDALTTVNEAKLQRPARKRRWVCS